MLPCSCLQHFPRSSLTAWKALLHPRVCKQPSCNYCLKIQGVRCQRHASLAMSVESQSLHSVNVIDGAIITWCQLASAVQLQCIGIAYISKTKVLGYPRHAQACTCGALPHAKSMPLCPYASLVRWLCVWTIAISATIPHAILLRATLHDLLMAVTL